jgi:hypothetical protein
MSSTSFHEYPLNHYDLDHVMNGDRMTTRVGAGGEFDALRSAPKRFRRRMIGCGMLRPGALDPDQVAERLAFYFGREFSSCEAVDWYFDNCRRELRYRDAVRHPTIYRRRVERLQRAGFRSLWHYRTEVLGHGA